MWDMKYGDLYTQYNIVTYLDYSLFLVIFQQLYTIGVFNSMLDEDASN